MPSRAGTLDETSCWMRQLDQRNDHEPAEPAWWAGLQQAGWEALQVQAPERSNTTAEGGVAAQTVDDLLGSIFLDSGSSGRCMVEPTSDDDARAAGMLLGKAGRSDIVDALVVLGAARRGDEVLTSDPSDLAALVEASTRSVTLTVV